MSCPEILWYGESILGCGQWPGLDSGKKGSGPIMSNFWGPFFHFFGVKKFFLNFFKNISATALKSYIKWLLHFFLFFEKVEKSWKNHFFRAKNATVSTLRSGTDFCWLFCGPSYFISHGFVRLMIYIKLHSELFEPIPNMRTTRSQTKKEIPYFRE